MRLPLLALLVGCHPGCRPPVPAAGAADSATTGPPADTATDPGTGDDTAEEDTALPVEACDAPKALRAEWTEDAGHEAGRALAFTAGPHPVLAVGVPELDGGAGAVRLLPVDDWAAPQTLVAAETGTVGRALAAGPSGGLVVAGRLADGARTWWLADPAAAPADLSAAPGYRTTGDGAGVSVAVSGEGAAVTLLVGLPRGAEAGVVWALPPPEAPDQAPDGPRLWGEHLEDYAGAVVRDVGDLDGDGLPDLAVGAFGHDGPGPMGGRLYVVHGPWGEASLADADGVLDGAESWDLFGWSVAGGRDLDRDGRDDLVVGAPGTNGLALSVGAAHVFLGPVDGPGGAATAWATLEGPAEDARLGWSVAALAGGPARIAAGGPGYAADGGGVWLAEVQPGLLTAGAPVLAGTDRAGVGGTLLAGDPSASGCDLLAVGAPDAGLAWVFGAP